MIYKIEINNIVKEDILEISDSIYKKSFSKEISKKYYNEIYSKIYSLKIFPYRYPEFNENYRVLTIDRKYKVFFKINEKKNSVIISRIFSSRQNYFDNF